MNLSPQVSRLVGMVPGLLSGGVSAGDLASAVMGAVPGLGRDLQGALGRIPGIGRDLSGIAGTLIPRSDGSTSPYTAHLPVIGNQSVNGRDILNRSFPRVRLSF
jgi:hypothetical protein